MKADADKVAAAKKSLNVVYDADTAALVKTGGTEASSITWTTSDSTYVDTTPAVVKHPSLAEKDQEITLTATITEGTATDTKVFKVVIPAKATTQEKIDGATKELKLNVDLSNVTEDIILPATGSNGTTITWVSGDATVIGNDGKLATGQVGKVSTTLTATVTHPDKTTETDGTKVFNITINFGE